MRHDDVLKVIFNFLQTHLPPNHFIMADLGQSPRTFADIVIRNEQERTVTLLELYKLVAGDLLISTVSATLSK